MLPSRTDSATTGKKLDAEGVVVWGHIHAFVVDVGPVLRLFRFTPSNRKLRYLLLETTINPHLLQRQDVPGETFREVQQFKRERRFPLLGHIHHILVDDGALFPFSPSGKDTTNVN